MPAATVRVAAVQQRELASEQTFVGTVVPLRTSTVGSTVEGRVVELLVREGDQVKEHGALAQLRIEQLQIQLAAANAELEVRKQELSELRISLPEEIKQAEDRMEAAEALAKYTGSQLQRARALFKSKTISEEELQEKESAARAAQEKYSENKVALALAKAVSPVKVLRAEATVAVQEEAVRQLKDDIAEHTIVAPFDGYVTMEHTEKGEWIAKGSPVVEVVELSSVDVEVSVLESYLPRLRVGMMARVTIGALPGESWEAPVAAIVPQADVRSRSFPVKVRLKNRDGPGGVLLKSGMFARVSLPVGDRASVLLVPKDALVLGGRSPVVYVADPLPQSRGGNVASAQGAPPAAEPAPGPAPDAVARLVPVELGTAADEWIKVRGGLKPGDRVVVEGNERLFPGQPVVILNREP
ncbi:MAG: hypothetical protein A2V70_09580 [Planctomycetes bacterium RBG_13_63_9]|nr:MAG: hypothetical protein A2V70_09580 [Planctomycetes bacterium RBG_13_63_9]